MRKYKILKRVQFSLLMAISKRDVDGWVGKKRIEPFCTKTRWLCYKMKICKQKTHCLPSKGYWWIADVMFILWTFWNIGDFYHKHAVQEFRQYTPLNNMLFCKLRLAKRNVFFSSLIAGCRYSDTSGCFGV